jgi:LysM repeat protein
VKLESTKLVYQVQRGDTLTGIAKKHDASVDAIVRQNKLSSKVIRVGQKLHIEKPQHLRGAREAVVVPRRRLPRANFARSAVTSAPGPAPTQNDN